MSQDAHLKHSQLGRNGSQIYLASISGIVSNVDVGACVVLVSDPGFSVLVAFIHREGGVVIQVDSGQRLDGKINPL